VGRLELVNAYDEAWRTFSWSEHLTLELPYPHEAPHVSGGTLVLPVNEAGGALRSFVVQSVPSPLRGIPGRQWRIDLDFVVEPFVVDAAQDLLAVVPVHDTQTFVPTRCLSVCTCVLTVSHRAACSCVRSLRVNHTPFLPMGESFVWKLAATPLWGIANTRSAATFSV
jgi:hypothetical protein